MQKLIILLSLIFFSSTLFAQQKKRINYYELDVIKGLFFQPNTIDPYTGVAFDKHSGGKKKMEVPIKDGKIHGVTREWAKNGKKVFEATYEKGVQVGTETQWYVIGKKKLEINYVAGKAEGVCTEWYKNGRKKSEGMFKFGKEEGEHTWWFDSGKVDQKVFYKNGMANGEVKNWFRSGQLKLQSEYKDGVQNGKTTEWYADGTKKSEEFFKAGKEDGKAMLWSKSGILIAEKLYQAGRLLEDKNYLSGSIFFGKGYAEVFNEREDFFTLKIIGKQVDPRQSEEITYVVDGKLLQVFNIPVTNFSEDGNSDIAEKDLLEKYIAQETELIQKEIEAEINVTTSAQKTSNGKEFIYWKFQSPIKKTNKSKEQIVKEEHYISFLCGSRVLSLYSLVTNSNRDEEVSAMLLQIAKTLEIHDERIDLNALTKTLLEK